MKSKIDILIKSLTFIGLTGANWIFNRKRERWEILRKDHKIDKKSLIYNARPFPVEVERNGKKILEWFYELTLYPDSWEPLKDHIDVNNPPEYLSVILMQDLEDYVLGRKLDTERQYYIPAPELKLTPGTNIQLSGGYYQKKWKSDTSAGIDHCLQVKFRGDLKVIPKPRRLSPFDVPTRADGRIKAQYA